MKNETSFMGVKEYYGKTKVTGNMNDAIKFGKPIILSKHYHANEDFIFREEDDLESQIIRVASTMFSFKKFSKESVLKLLEDALENLLTK